MGSGTVAEEVRALLPSQRHPILPLLNTDAQGHENLFRQTGHRIMAAEDGPAVAEHT